MEKDEALEITKWHYESTYSFYDLENDQDDLQEFLNLENTPNKSFFSALNENMELAGFFELTHREDCIEVGLGMRPDLTGMGMGLSFVQSGMKFLRTNYPIRKIKLLVLSSNKRAQIVYERAGFMARDSILMESNNGKFCFTEMVLEP